VWHCAEQYELAYPGYEGDRDYYLEKGKNGRVLYLGVGTGRIFGKMAEQNPAAVGLDSSPEMLDLLRRKFSRLTDRQLMLADAVNAPLSANQFDTIVAPYSFLQVVKEEQLAPLLDSVHRWLKPGGRFHTDTFSSFLIPFSKKGLEASIRCIGGETRIAIYVLYDHLRQTMKEMALVSRGQEEKLLEMNLHYYFPHELEKAMRSAGFDSVNVYGGYHGEPFNPSENEVTVFEARKVDRSNGNGQLPHDRAIPS